jgi:hypothetical protein
METKTQRTKEEETIMPKGVGYKYLTKGGKTKVPKKKRRSKKKKK